MLRLRTPPILVAVSLAGCPADGDGDTSGTQEVSSGSAAAVETEGATESEPGETDDSSSGGSGISLDDFTAQCLSQVDREGCESAEGFEGEGAGEPQFAGCVWETSVPIALEASGACSFGEPAGRCIVVSSSTVGCASPTVECATAVQGTHVFGGVRSGDDGSVLVEGNVCFEHENAVMCFVDAEGNVADGGPAECGCFCDAGYPS